MKKIRLILPLVILFVAMQLGCNDNKQPATNASAKDTTATTDTTMKKDTIKSDPDKFSDPH